MEPMAARKSCAVFLQNTYRLEEGEKWDEESLRRRRSKNSGAILYVVSVDSARIKYSDDFKKLFMCEQPEWRTPWKYIQECGIRYDSARIEKGRESMFEVERNVLLRRS